MKKQLGSVVAWMPSQFMILFKFNVILNGTTYIRNYTATHQILIVNAYKIVARLVDET